ncbi:MAG: S8 family serine peptidase, partial [Proteobacteria bacterium]|nr:S8 family serine peptidase [Pseudomonadota bacterium]
MRTRCWSPWAYPRPRAVALALLGVVALLPHGATTARAEVPFPTCASVGCADPYDYGAYLKNDPANVLDPPSPEERVPNDFNPASGEAWKFLSETGLNIVEAWGLTTGRPDVVIAVLDSGILWAAPDVRNKAALNTDELPVPVGCPDPVSPSQLPHDCNGDGVVNVVDFAGQVCPGGPVADANGNGALDAQDLILLCSDGVDGVAGAAAPVANGYIDDISGWDFHEDDNDPFDDVDAGHGTGQAHDSTAEAHNFGGFPGVAPSAMFLPLRVGDHFVAVGQDFARAVVYATDWRVSVIQEALGAVSQSPVGQAAVDYAYANGVPIIASAADEESRHHNYPANFEHTIWVNSIRDGDGTLAEAPDPQRYDLLNGCTNYGGRAWIAISSASCSSEATGRGAGVAGLLVSHGKNLVDAGAIEAWDALLGIPYSAEEVRQIFRASAEDIDYEGNLELDIDSLISTFLSGPTPETAFGSSRFPTQAGWDQFTGFGRPDTVRMLDIAENAIPPEADLSGGPRWFDVIDPDETPSVELRGSASAWRVDGFVNVSIQAGCGVQPTAFDELDTLVVVAGLDAALLTVWDPAATAASCGFDPAVPIEDPDAHAVTLRMVVTDRLGRRGEDRRTVAIHSDPTLRFPPRHLGASGEASPALVDVRRDGKLEIVYGTGGGALHVLNGRKGKDLPGFPVYTDPIPVHDSPAYDSGAVPIPREPIIAGVAADDLDGDGEIEIVAASAEGKLYVWDAHGNRRAGFPVATDPALSLPEDRDRFNDADVGIFAAPTLADLDGQPGLEILVAAADGHLYAWHDDGSEVEGFPVRVADPERVDLDPVTGKATPIAGQDVRTRGRKLIGSPAVGDLDGDGTPEIIATSNEEYGDGDGFGTNSILLQLLLQGVVEIGDEFDLDTTGRVYAIHADGNAHDGGPFVDGWPVAVPMLVSGLLPNVATGIPGAPALADLDPTDGDDGLVVAIFSAAGPAMVYGPDGSPLLGVDLFGKFNSLAADFPGGGFAVTVPDSVGSADGPFVPALGSGAFGDLDGDGLPEYAAPTVGIRKLIDVAAPGLQS